MKNMTYIQDFITIIKEKGANFLESLSIRDRIITIIITVFIIGLIIFIGIIRPIILWNYHNKIQLQKSYADLVFVRKNLPIAIQAEMQNRQLASQNIISLINQSATSNDINFSKIQPNKQGIALWSEITNYQKLLAWLSALQKRTLWHVVQFKIEKTPEPGMVKAFMSLGK